MVETWIDGSLFAFDGRVVVAFGFPGEGDLRYHIRNLKLTVDEPDAKGRRCIHLRPWSTGAGSMSMHISADAWPAAQPFLEHVESAIAQSRAQVAAA
jgi:hypothetical protein